MTHRGINQRGGGGGDRAVVCSGIFLTSICPALTALLFLCYTPATTKCHYTDSRLGARPQLVTVPFTKHTVVFRRCAQGQISPSKMTVTVRKHVSFFFFPSADGLRRGQQHVDNMCHLQYAVVYMPAISYHLSGRRFIGGL